MNQLQIHLVSRKKEVLDELEQILRGMGHQLRRSLVVNGHVDPLHGIEQLPNVVVLHLSHLWREELEAYAAHPVDRRPALIIVGATSDLNVMRLAMQAGARDLLPMPLVSGDFVQAIERLQGESRARITQASGVIDVFINAKGGCGATLLACNVAHVLRCESKQRVAVVDLDLQFGAVPLYFDLFPKRGLSDALENLGAMDELALAGYFTRHPSGLEVLSHATDQPLAMEELSASAVNQLLSIALRDRDRLVVDLPRRIDPVTASVMERAQHIVVVLQQSMTALRDAGRMLQWMRAELSLGRERLCVVVNRYDKAASITLDNIRSALSCDDPVVIPNDFRTVSECVNSGVPLLDHARGSAIAKAIMTLESRLGGISTTESSGLLSRTFSSLLSGRSR
ncbi:MAG: AAA family ATPase [Steroidobacteraceae bacterium]